MAEPDTNLPGVPDDAGASSDAKPDRDAPAEASSDAGAAGEVAPTKASPEEEAPPVDRAPGSIPLEVLAANPERQLEMAREALVRGEPAMAAAILQHAGTLSFEAREMLGAALFQAGDLAAGIAIFEETVDTRPTSPQAHYNLASAYRKAGRPADAYHQLEIALRLEPRYRAALLARQEWTAEDATGTEDEGRRTEDAIGTEDEGRRTGDAARTEDE